MLDCAWFNDLMIGDTEKTCGLLQVSSLISVQLDRAEYIFLLRLTENLKETAAFFDHQEKYFNPMATTQKLVIGGVLPQLDVSVIFPPLAASVLQVYFKLESITIRAIFFLLKFSLLVFQFIIFQF